VLQYKVALSDSFWAPVVGFCEHDYEPSCSLNVGKFLIS